MKWRCFLKPQTHFSRNTESRAEMNRDRKREIVKTDVFTLFPGERFTHTGWVWLTHTHTHTLVSHYLCMCINTNTLQQIAWYKQASHMHKTAVLWHELWREQTRKWEQLQWRSVIDTVVFILMQLHFLFPTTYIVSFSYWLVNEFKYLYKTVLTLFTGPWAIYFYFILFYFLYIFFLFYFRLYCIFYFIFLNILFCFIY